MPVELSRIKGRFKELFKADLSNKRLDELSARLNKKIADDAEDSAIDLILNDANDVYPFEDMVKDEHRLVAAENKAKQKPEPAPAPAPTEPTPNPSPEPENAMEKLLRELTASVQELKEGKVVESKTQAARAEFDKSDIFKSTTEKGREFYFRQLDVNSEVPIADQISELETTHSEITQSRADSTDYAGKPPVHTSNEKADKELIKRIVGS